MKELNLNEPLIRCLRRKYAIYKDSSYWVLEETTTKRFISSSNCEKPFYGEKN